MCGLPWRESCEADAGAGRVGAPLKGSGSAPRFGQSQRDSHRDSRFYYDPGFPNQRCDELYETWIDRSCHGYADTVLVAEYRPTSRRDMSLVTFIRTVEGAIGTPSRSLFAPGAPTLESSSLAGALGFFGGG